LKTSSSPAIRNTFKRAGLFMVGAYIEGNPLKKNASGSWLRYFNSLKRALINLISQPRINNNLITIKQMDAMDLEYEDESMDFCFTDPPYYDNMPYASSMDFFYPWFREILKNSYPELFLTSSTPKDTELIQDRFRHNNSTKNAKIFYEKGMGKAFSEIYRVLKKNGLAVIVFAHKDINAWETLLQAINDSNLVITSTWPLLMEMAQGMRTVNVVSLDSVVLLVCRKIIRKNKRYYDEIFRQELEQIIMKKLERQWRLGLRGADFFLSSLGPAIEAFSKYEAVLDVKTDKSINIHEYLKFVDTILIKFTLGKTLNKGYSSIDAETQFYLVWRASYKLSMLPYDEIWKFTHTLGLDDSNLEGKIIKKVLVKSKTLYKCLETLDKKEKFLEKKFTPSSLIEALQHSGYLWSENSPFLDEIINIYQEKYGDEFWHVAQSVSNLIPDSNDSKLFLSLLRKYRKVVVNQKKKNIKSKPIQQTFRIEGKNIILKRMKKNEFMDTKYNP
jgi:adenine-specific DNA methylase